MPKLNWTGQSEDGVSEEGWANQLRAISDLKPQTSFESSFASSNFLSLKSSGVSSVFVVNQQQSKNRWSRLTFMIIWLAVIDSPSKVEDNLVLR